MPGKIEHGDIKHKPMKMTITTADGSVYEYETFVAIVAQNTMPIKKAEDGVIVAPGDNFYTSVMGRILCDRDVLVALCATILDALTEMIAQDPSILFEMRKAELKPYTQYEKTKWEKPLEG